MTDGIIYKQAFPEFEYHGFECSNLVCIEVDESDCY